MLPPPNVTEEEWSASECAGILFRICTTEIGDRGRPIKVFTWMNGDLEVGPYGFANGTIARVLIWYDERWLSIPFDYVPSFPFTSQRVETLVWHVLHRVYSLNFIDEP